MSGRIGERRAGEAAWRDATARARVCPACLGTGLFGEDIEPATWPSQCPTCDGVGRVPGPAPKPPPEWPQEPRDWLGPLAWLAVIGLAALVLVGLLQRLGWWPW